MKSISPKLKLKAITEVLRDKIPLSQVSKKYGCTRQSLHFWIKIYQKNPLRALKNLQDGHRRGKKHPKSIAWRVEKLVLDLAIKEPDLGLRRLKSRLSAAGFKVSEHGIYNILVRNELQTKELRHRFSFIHPVKTLFAGSIVPAYRARVVEEYIKEGKKISQVCRVWKISRVTFYAWLKRYKKAIAEESGDAGVIEALERGYKSGWDNSRSCSQSARDLVRDIVVRNPEYSVHKIYAQIPRVDGKPVVGHHGIQNILAREDLNTYEKRLGFAQGVMQVPEVAIAPLYTPEMPLYKLRHLIAHFATIPRLLISDPKKGLPYAGATLSSLILFILWIRLLFTTPNASPFGLFFSSIALFFGLFFFIYSMKYYITVLLVLKLAQGGGNNQPTKLERQIRTTLARIPGFENLIRAIERHEGEDKAVNPLTLSLDKITLKTFPFVSIHVALFNERRVVERLIRACEAQEYYEETIDNSPFDSAQGKQLTIDQEDQKSTVNGHPFDELRMTLSIPKGQLSTVGPAAYEVIIVDDSTDETTDMAKQLLSSEGRILDRVRMDSEMEIYVSSPPVGSSLPVIKLIHRFSRSGFKGGALQRALENTNPKAEYISVFDADFVPYPDTIEQFVKTFQELNANVDANINIQMDANISIDSHNSNSLTNSHSNIAAVQGYQWHVLNKSQTWITRGVRTEYAGSYVIERAGEEIYGGLKQIAGSVYAIRADVLRQFGWGTSITEDFELTLRLYEAGYKVAFTPYIQAPAEAVSTIKRLVRQRMRWAEGASYNIKIMLPRLLFGRWEATPDNDTGSRLDESGHDPVSSGKVWRPSGLTRTEKLEFAYLAPYYLQAAFFVVGTFSWFISEAILGSRLPFWTAALGWSLVFTNILALPLMNIVGLFLEESDERDYIGILSFVALSYIVVPFQAYAAIKGFIESEEGPWFRTPKTGIVTDTFGRSKFGKFFGNIFGPRPGVSNANSQMSFSSNRESLGVVSSGRTSDPRFSAKGGSASGGREDDNGEGRSFNTRAKYLRFVGNFVLGLIVTATLMIALNARLVPYKSENQTKESTIMTVEQESLDDSVRLASIKNENIEIK